MPDTKKPAKRSAAPDTSSSGFTAEEKAAMRERAKERKAASDKAEALKDVLAKIAEMPDADRVMAERFHALVMASAPDLVPRTWYGMPAYYKGGKNICFFQAADKFKARYATFGFNEDAMLDDGAVADTWALKKLTAADEAKIAALVKKAGRLRPATRLKRSEPGPRESSQIRLSGQIIASRLDQRVVRDGPAYRTSVDQSLPGEHGIGRRRPNVLFSRPSQWATMRPLRVANPGLGP